MVWAHLVSPTNRGEIEHRLLAMKGPRSKFFTGSLLAPAVLFLGTGGLLTTFGPREPVDLTARLEAVPDTNLDDWIAEREAEFTDLRDGAQKEIIWIDPVSKDRTKFAVVYIHGFSASKQEIRPVPDKLAAGLKANLYFTRLSGHGRDSSAMAEPSVGDWVHDLDEAIKIGRRIGEQIILVSTSTGSSLVALGLTQEDLAENVEAVVFVSPNFKLVAKRAYLLTWPFARQVVPLVIGSERGFEPLNDAHARHWTDRYPTVATMPMAALVEAASNVPFEQINVPAFFTYSPKDQVVDPVVTRAAADRWGGPVQILEVRLQPNDDPSSHIIAGDIASPSQTEPLADALIRWAKSL